MKYNDFCAHLVPILGVSAGNLVETTRWLKEGSSHFRGKPGPGGGLEVTPFIGAFLLVSLLLPVSRKEAAKATWDIWKYSPAGTIKVAWYAGEAPPERALDDYTGSTMFGAALEKILSDQTLASGVHRLVVFDHASRGAEIHFGDNRVARFCNPLKPAGAIIRSAEVGQPALSQLAGLLAE